MFTDYTVQASSLPVATWRGLHLPLHAMPADLDLPSIRYCRRTATTSCLSAREGLCPGDFTFIHGWTVQGIMGGPGRTSLTFSVPGLSLIWDGPAEDSPSIDLLRRALQRILVDTQVLRAEEELTHRAAAWVLAKHCRTLDALRDMSQADILPQLPAFWRAFYSRSPLGRLLAGQTVEQSLLTKDMHGRLGRIHLQGKLSNSEPGALTQNYNMTA